MTRGLPYSLVVHVLVLVLVVVYGNHVTRRPPRLPRAIAFRMVHSPAAQTHPVPAQTVDKPPVAAETEPVVENPVHQTEPDLPPKQVPEKTGPEKQVQEAEPVVQAAEPEVLPEKALPEDDSEAPETTAAAQAGPRVGTTDGDFPFAWYLSRIEGLVDRNWNPRQLGFRGDMITCTVHFEVSRAGVISGVSLVSGSGIGVFDREALRAVMATHLPPLPPQYGGARLGVSFIFNLEPDS